MFTKGEGQSVHFLLAYSNSIMFTKGRGLCTDYFVSCPTFPHVPCTAIFHCLLLSPYPMHDVNMGGGGSGLKWNPIFFLTCPWHHVYKGNGVLCSLLCLHLSLMPKACLQRGGVTMEPCCFLLVHSIMFTKERGLCTVPFIYYLPLCPLYSSVSIIILSSRPGTWLLQVVYQYNY